MLNSEGRKMETVLALPDRIITLRNHSGTSFMVQARSFLMAQPFTIPTAMIGDVANDQ